MGEEGKEVYALKRILFSEEEKLMSPTGQKHNVAFGLLLKSLLPASHAAWLCGKKEKSVSTRCLTEKGTCRQQLVNQPQPGVCGTWQILTLAPQWPSWAAVEPSSDADQKPKCRDILEKGVWEARWQGNLGVCLPASREGAEQVGWQKIRRMGMIKCFKLCFIFYRSRGEHYRSSRVTEKLKVNRMFVNF